MVFRFHSFVRAYRDLCKAASVEVDHMLGDFIDRGARALAPTSLLPIVMDNSAEQSAESLWVPLHIELSKTAPARRPD
jgi:hypothetical protein